MLFLQLRLQVPPIHNNPSAFRTSAHVVLLITHPPPEPDLLPLDLGATRPDAIRAGRGYHLAEPDVHLGRQTEDALREPFRRMVQLHQRPYGVVHQRDDHAAVQGIGAAVHAGRERDQSPHFGDERLHAG